MTDRRDHGRHRPPSRRVRRRRAILALAGLGVAAATVLASVVFRDQGVERVCSRPDELPTRGNVTLIPDAMDAYLEAEATVGQNIDVVESYRTCRKQAEACEGICGSRRGCPGACAPPGLSWHQRAEAIDVTQEMLDTSGVLQALEEAGWCQSLPDTDPGHFSFDGCH
ncbi:MAG: hypothetical protein L0206_00255 [Actinobacteria bacterium]|nr:hypothetical protein [Actinomycetota bacterium]